MVELAFPAWRRGWLFATILFGIVACSAAAMPELAPPAGTQRYVEERSFNPLIDAAETELLGDLRRDYGTLETQRWTVPRSLDFSALVAHYRAQLGNGWKEDSRLAGPSNTNPRVLFTRDRKVVALVYVAPSGADIAVLIVAQSAK
ncbi:MAG: hypothetical protein J0I77_17190 [Rudaea sp.]|uniref:hypothetical protein n=1 Tax=unclassified Rudaea TaxID=2627037 RepID=UPI0010F45C6B|nr:MULTISPECIES: hypothetical protein [unclassified Rudaea]MBN8887462.1 hypothetical protein [Rudaea sp.]MBR0344262.1 hypothetical protein [Rudaea sp.]